MDHALFGHLLAHHVGSPALLRGRLLAPHRLLLVGHVRLRRSHESALADDFVRHPVCQFLQFLADSVVKFVHLEARAAASAGEWCGERLVVWLAASIAFLGRLGCKSATTLSLLLRQ